MKYPTKEDEEFERWKSFYDSATFALADFIEEELMSGAKMSDVRSYVDMIVKDAFSKMH